MSIEDLRKGKSVEYFVFSELIKRGSDLYLPVIDTDINAIIPQKDGSYLEIQVKSTEKEDQAGYFNVYDIEQHPEDKFFIICVDMNEERAKVKGKPNIWVLSAKDFKEYMTSGCRLPIYERSRRYNNEVRCELLKTRFYAWGLLTG